MSRLKKGINVVEVAVTTFIFMCAFGSVQRCSAAFDKSKDKPSEKQQPKEIKAENPNSQKKTAIFVVPAKVAKPKM